MKLRALIFDVDGTLAETEEAHRHAFNQTFTASGLDWFWDRKKYADLLLTTGGKERMQRFRNEIGLNTLSDEEIAELHERKTKCYSGRLTTTGIPLRPGVADLIMQAKKKGIKVAIATTTSRKNVDTLVESCWKKPVSDVFDVVAAGDEVRSKKPASDVFDLALQRLGLYADACVAFEDSVNGLKSAKSAGLRVVITPSSYTANEDFSSAEWIVQSLEEKHLPSDLMLVLNS